MTNVFRPERALIGAGAIATICWFIDRAYVVEVAGSSLWTFALATALGQVALGLLVTFNKERERFLAIASYYQIALILGGFTISHTIAKPNVVTAHAILLGASLLTLLWRGAGKVRTIIGWVTVTAETVLMIVGATRRL